MSSEFAGVVLVFMLAPLSRYIFWVGLELTQASRDRPLTEPWITAILMMATAAIFEIPTLGRIAWGGKGQGPLTVRRP